MCKSFRERIRLFLNRNKRYKSIEENGLNVLVETEGSKARTEKRRFLINMFFTVVSAVAAVAAAIFAALTYINSKRKAMTARAMERPELVISAV